MELEGSLPYSQMPSYYKNKLYWARFSAVTMILLHVSLHGITLFTHTYIYLLWSKGVYSDLLKAA